MTGCELIAKKGFAHFVAKVRHDGHDFLDEFEDHIDWSQGPSEILIAYLDWREKRYGKEDELRANQAREIIAVTRVVPIKTPRDFQLTVEKAVKLLPDHDYSTAYDDYQLVIDCDKREIRRIK